MEKKGSPAGGKSNFDRLASGITKKERKEILNKLNPLDIEIRIPTEAEENAKNALEEAKENELNTKKGLLKKFNHESFLRKLIVWVKSLVFNSSVEEVYNTAVVSALAKQIERVFPGLINYKQRILCGGMYNNLLDLKSCQDFFKSQMDMVDSDSGLFYFMLGKFVMPDAIDEIKKICDPFQYSLDKPLGQDTRTTLLNRLDEQLNLISADDREKMGEYSQSYEWLKMFTKLPIAEMLNKFTSSSDGRTCLFSQLRSEFRDFAKILTAKTPLTEEFAKIFFSFKTDMKNIWVDSENSMTDENLEDNLKTASLEIATIEMFGKKVPIKDVGKVIFENSLFVPEVFSPGDNWLQKYRETWRVVFDQRWRQWNREFKKEEMKKKQKIFFNISDFQKFPYHPWRKYSDVYPFKFDYTLGFINYYMKQEYPKYAGILNVVTLEGDFQIKENRHEFTDLVADYNEIMDGIEVLVKQVALGGEYGAEFMRYDASIKSKSHKERIVTILSEIEEKADEITKLFTNASHNFENLVKAMLGDHVTVYYGPLINLNKIMGRDNREFRETLERFAHSVKFVGEIMAGLRDIDTFKV